MPRFNIGDDVIVREDFISNTDSNYNLYAGTVYVVAFNETESVMISHIKVRQPPNGYAINTWYPDSLFERAIEVNPIAEPFVTTSYVNEISVHRRFEEADLILNSPPINLRTTAVIDQEEIQVPREREVLTISNIKILKSFYEGNKYIKEALMTLFPKVLNKIKLSSLSEIHAGQKYIDRLGNKYILVYPGNHVWISINLSDGSLPNLVGQSIEGTNRASGITMQQLRQVHGSSRIENCYLYLEDLSTLSL